MNFGDIKNYVRTYSQGMFSFNKKSEGGQFDLKDELLESFINEGYRLFCSHGRTVKEKKYIATTAGVTKYDLSGAVALQTTLASNNLVQAINVYYESGADKWKLDPIQDKEELMVELNASDSPFKYGLQYGNKQINVYPKVSTTSENIWIYGVWLPVDMTLDADEPQIPVNYHQALCSYAIFKIQLLMGVIDQTKQNAFQQAQLFEQSFINLADMCRKEIEYIENVHYQMREDSEDDWTSREYLPIFNHSPLISLLMFKDILQFKDITSGTIRLQVDATGIYVNGSALAFVGVRGTDNFAGYTGTTVVTIADQGSVNYSVQLTPILTGAPDGSIGEFGYVIDSATQFTVYNSGASTGEFSYLVTKS